MRPAKRKSCQETAKRGSGNTKRGKELVNDNLNKIIQRQSTCRDVGSDSDEQPDSVQPVRLTHRSVTRSRHARKRDRLVAGRALSQPVHSQKSVQTRSVKSAGKIRATPMVDSLSDIDGEDQESNNILSLGTQNHKRNVASRERSRSAGQNIARNKTRRVVNRARSDIDGEDQEYNNILSRGTQNHKRIVASRERSRSGGQNIARNKTRRVVNRARSDIDGEDQEYNNILSRGTQNHKRNVASRERSHLVVKT